MTNRKSQNKVWRSNKRAKAQLKPSSKNPVTLYQWLLNRVRETRVRWPLSMALGIGFGVIIVNSVRSPGLPLFMLFFVLFFTVLAISYYSIHMNERNLKTLEKQLNEKDLSRRKISYIKRKGSDLNFLWHVISLYVFLLPICYTGDTDRAIVWVCFSALFVIVNVSIAGYTQYVHFLVFIHSIAEEKSPISSYNKDDPNDTNWLVNIAKNTQKYSVMFFITGMCYILLFFVYSQSGLFPQANSLGAMLVVQCAWILLVVGIVVVYPLTSLFAVKDVKRIADKLKKQQLNVLENRRNHFEDELLKINYTNAIMTLRRTPEYPIKITLSSLFSGAIEAVNIAAAVISIMPIYQLVLSIMQPG